MPGGMRDAARLQELYAAILAELVEPTEGTEATDRRAALALLEMTDGYTVDIPGLFTTFDSEGYDQIMTGKGIPFFSLCEHHMLPFYGEADIAYIPNGKVVGLSKIARVVDAFAKRLQIQERMGMQIADALEQNLDAHGVMVILEAEHSCVRCRGVKKPGVAWKSSVLRGTFRDNGQSRIEALMLLQR